MFYYNITKVGSCIQGIVNGWYKKKESVIPRLYHRYIKEENKNNLYPDLKKEEEGGGEGEQPDVVNPNPEIPPENSEVTSPEEGSEQQPIDNGEDPQTPIIDV